MKILRKKSFFFILVGTLLLFPFVYADQTEDTKFENFELENGMKVFLYERHSLPLLNIVFAFDVGTKNETDANNGLVHILEHYILYRGTEMRSGEEIGKDIRSHGAYFNAHTGRDLATFELSLPSEFADFALENQREILFHLKLTQEELDIEKQIILEELSQVLDDPIKYGTSLVYQNLFQNHPYQRPIFGKKDIIEAATVEQIQQFHNNYFVPANCALAVVGDFDMQQMKQKIRSMFGELENNGFIPQEFEKVQPLKKNIEIEEEMDVNTGYLVIGIAGPDYNNEDQYVVDVLVEVLGRGVIPLLNQPLRGRRELVETISMGFGAYKYGGIIYVYLTLDPKKTSAAKRETLKFLRNARSLNFSKSDYQGDAQFYALDYMESAKNQIKFRFHQAQEKGLNLALSLAAHALRSDGEERGSYIANIESITSPNMRKAAGEFLSKAGYVLLSIVPKKQVP
ncbi:MAG: insulinase family protein [Candidatus Aminicenantes bacterium]|nr:MAG: insulinase family protein [Candidatus Aminicenantes bacterium]